jgi:hypothetical protein
MHGQHDDFGINKRAGDFTRCFKPPIPGMFISISTTSAELARHHFTASSPQHASPATLIPLSSRMRRIPARTSSWSSTRRTLIKGNVSRIGITLLTANLVYINGFHRKIKTLKTGFRFCSRFWKLACTEGGKKTRTASAFAAIFKHLHSKSYKKPLHHQQKTTLNFL